MSIPYKSNFSDVDIASGVIERSFAHISIGENDNNANIFGVNVLKNKSDFNLAGCACVGFFVRADGNTTVINGSVEGNKAYVEVPQACYAYAGVFTLTIKVSGTNFAGTLRIVDGTVVETSTGSLIDPGNVIPDLSDWTALVEDAQEAAEEIGKIHIENEQIQGTRYKIKVYKNS